MSPTNTGPQENWVDIKIEGLDTHPILLHYDREDIADEVLEVFARYGLVKTSSGPSVTIPVQELLKDILRINGIIAEGLARPFNSSGGSA